MEILNGLFRSPCSFLTKDNYGGNTFDVYVYVYVYVYNGSIYYFSIIGYSMDFDDNEHLKNIDRIITNSPYVIKKSITENSVNVLLNNGICIYGNIFENGIRLLLSGKNKKGELFMTNVIFEKQNIII